MTATAPAVFITVPKFVAITPSYLPKIRPAPAANTTAAALIASRMTTKLAPASDSAATYHCATSVNVEDAVEAECDAATQSVRGKKRRLDHLTWEEKIQRKKLKNRVAAQTSRDRKKARMEEMDNEIQELTEKTEILHNKCESLQVINDSLLEKNRKLDMEVELLRQQLNELQEQQKQQLKQLKQTTDNAKLTNAVATCAGSGINQNGLTVDTRTTAEPACTTHGGVTLEDCCPLPSLQDVLLLAEEQFDAGKLEELAESLLADITADLEAGDRASDASAAEIASSTKRLSGRMVGAAAERLESGQHIARTANSRGSFLASAIDDVNIDLGMDIDICSSEMTPKLEARQAESETEAKHTLTLQNILNYNGKAQQNKHGGEEIKIDQALPTTTPDTVYGTYDAKTNSISIVMGDDAEPVNEAVEEIYCDDSTPSSSDANDDIYCSKSPMQVLVNVNCASTAVASDDEDDCNFDPISQFLCPQRPLVSPLAKSPAHSVYSMTSDHGYESILGSPPPLAPAPPIAVERFDDTDTFGGWQSSFDELFPTLI